MRQIAITDLKFERAGSDYLSHSWSCHVTGAAFKQGEEVKLVRPDNSSFKVRVDSVKKGVAHLVEAYDQT